MSAAAAVARYADRFGRPRELVRRDLESFAALVVKWNGVQNLVSRETLSADLWPRHIADSLQVLKFLRLTDRVVLDLGSGGGFPAIPLAIASGGARQFVLVEPNARKASFLRTVSRELELGLIVESRRTEDIRPSELPTVDVVTSRALASLSVLCSLATPFFGTSTRALFHKGREHVDELAESHAVWHHDVVVHASDTSSSGVLLEMTNLRRK